VQILSPSMILAKARKGYTDKLGRTWKWNGVKYEYVRKGKKRKDGQRRGEPFKANAKQWETIKKRLQEKTIPAYKLAERSVKKWKKEDAAKKKGKAALHVRKPSEILDSDYSDLETKAMKKKGLKDHGYDNPDTHFKAGDAVHITKQGRGIEKPNGSAMHTMYFDDVMQAKKYAEKKGFKVRRIAGDALTVKGASSAAEVVSVRERSKKQQQKVQETSDREADEDEGGDEFVKLSDQVLSRVGKKGRVTDELVDALGGLELKQLKKLLAKKDLKGEAMRYAIRRAAGYEDD
jgi:hypothetical protein